MRKYLQLLPITLLGLLVLNSCDLMKDLNFTVNPNPLVLQGDSVKFNVDVKVPEKGLKKKVKAELTAKLGSTEIGMWTIQGEKVTGNGKTISFKPGGTANFEMILPYEDAIRAADLSITARVFKGKKEKSKEAIPETKIADATIVTQLLVNNTFEVLSLKNSLNRSSDSTLTAKINFDKGKFDVKSKELKDDDVKNMIEWIKSNVANPKIEINSIEISGYASPDGESAKNKTLSKNRSLAGREAMMGIFKKEKMNMFVDTIKYKLSDFGEDFDGFKAQLAVTNSIDDKDKQLFIRIIEMQSDLDKREEEMKNLGKSFTSLEKEVFPAIRRSRIILNYTKKGWTDEELLNLSSTNPDTLTEEEILYTTEILMNDFNEKLNLLDFGSKKFPSSVRILNNYGVALFYNGKFAESLTTFNAAKAIEENSAVLNNISALQIRDGLRSEARNLLKSASSSSSADQKSAIAYNNAILDIMDGEYQRAEKGLSKKSFNKALNAVLQNKLDEAVTILGGIDATDMTHYLSAIISMRKGEGVGSVVAHLNKAFAMNSELKQKAKEDREFVQLFGDSAFKDAVN